MAEITLALDGPGYSFLGFGTHMPTYEKGTPLAHASRACLVGGVGRMSRTTGAWLSGLADVGERLGVTEARVGQIRREALQMLRVEVA